LDLDRDESAGHWKIAKAAHTAMGMWSIFADQAWQEALKYMDTAVARDSTSSSQHLFRVWQLVALGRLEEALAEMRKALTLDPLAPTENARLGSVLVFLGRYDEAIATCERRSISVRRTRMRDSSWDARCRRTANTKTR